MENAIRYDAFIQTQGYLLKKQLKLNESRLYVCGSSLFPEDSPLADTVVVREAVICKTPIESQYYSSVLVHFPPICYYCGLGEESLVDDDELVELRKTYSLICISSGKEPFCKLPSNVAKKKKTDSFS